MEDMNTKGGDEGVDEEVGKWEAPAWNDNGDSLAKVCGLPLAHLVFCSNQFTGKRRENEMRKVYKKGLLILWLRIECWERMWWILK